MGDFSPEPKTVLITGYGPFGNHTINASWIAVQEFEKLGLEDSYNLIVKEIPVEYDSVVSIVPQLWEEYNPILMVHVGVSGIAKELTLEQVAHNDGYDKFDVNGKTPESYCCVTGGEDCLCSELDMNEVCLYVNKSGCGVKAVVSHDPGRYLCDFIYYKSLNINKKCSAFIHVPPLNKPYSGQQLAASLKQAVKAMLQQLT